MESNDRWQPSLKYPTKNMYHIIEEEGFAEVRLTKNQVMIIDIEDLKFLADHCVCAHYNSCTKSYYARTYVGRSRVGFHRIICPCEENQVVDHFDHDTLNNCLNNLRAVTPSINSRNMRQRNNNKSGVSGVYFHEKKNRWVAQIVGPKEPESKSFSVKIPDAFQHTIKWHHEKELEYEYISQPPSKEFIFNELEAPLIEYKAPEPILRQK